jgi:serine O-acetyltransferase
MFGKLIGYLDSIRDRDPAPRSRWEILLYPGVLAVGLHRVAHWLFVGRLFFLARLVNHLSRFLTAIDIHPGARIGKHLFIDHGFTVIGETCEIGDNVTIYQCVTLGGTNPTNGVPGKRHPTLLDNVIVGSGAQIRTARACRRQRGGDRRCARRRNDGWAQGAFHAGPGRNLAQGLHSLWHPVQGTVRADRQRTGR